MILYVFITFLFCSIIECGELVTFETFPLDAKNEIHKHLLNQEDWRNRSLSSICTTIKDKRLINKQFNEWPLHLNLDRLLWQTCHHNSLYAIDEVLSALANLNFLRHLNIQNYKKQGKKAYNCLEGMRKNLHRFREELSDDENNNAMIFVIMQQIEIDTITALTKLFAEEPRAVNYSKQTFKDDFRFFAGKKSLAYFALYSPTVLTFLINNGLWLDFSSSYNDLTESQKIKALQHLQPQETVYYANQQFSILRKKNRIPRNQLKLYPDLGPISTLINNAGADIASSPPFVTLKSLASTFNCHNDIHSILQTIIKMDESSQKNILQSTHLPTRNNLLLYYLKQGATINIDTQIVSDLLKYSDIDMADVWGVTPAYWCIANTVINPATQAPLINTLLTQYPSIDLTRGKKVGWYCYTPLELAMKSNNIQLREKIIAHLVAQHISYLPLSTIQMVYKPLHENKWTLQDELIAKMLMQRFPASKWEEINFFYD